MSVRTRSAKRIAAKRKMLAGNSEVLATGIGQLDNMRVGMIAAPRKVVVTERESIARKFTAPRLDMGEYAPVSTHNVEIAKYNGKDWTL